MIYPIGGEFFPFCFNELVVLRQSNDLALKKFEKENFDKDRKVLPIQELFPKIKYERTHKDATRHIDLIV